MANNDTQKEIAMLREQLEAMKKEREIQQEVEDTPEAEEITENKPASVAGETTETISDKDTEDIVEQFKELLKTIDEDIKETKPTTLLIVFALGVLVGRL